MPKISRRSFLLFTGGAGVALAADPPRKFINKLIPQIIPPENIKPGEWALYATTCRECPAGCGMHLWHRDGRVTKAEGNPDHPLNRGGLCPRGQASLQGLYDPDRLTTVIRNSPGAPGGAATWGEAMAHLGARLAAGGRVAIISSLQNGALAEVMQAFTTTFSSRGRLLFHEPFTYEPLLAAHRQLLGTPVVPAHNLERCEIILSFAADFLETWISPVAYATQFAAFRSSQGGGEARRFVYVGPRLSMTAANADEFLQVPPGQERLVAAALLRIIIRKRLGKNNLSPLLPSLDRLLPSSGPVAGVPAEELDRLATAFATAGEGVALAGPVGATSPLAAETAMLVALLNHATGRIGKTVNFSRPHALSRMGTETDLQRLLASLGANDILFICDTNPVYSRNLQTQLRRAGTVVYLGTMPDETAAMADWVLPLDYPLETWGDYEPEAGIHGLIQPTLRPLHETRSPGDIFLHLARAAGRPLVRSGAAGAAEDFPSWLRERWQQLGGEVGRTGADFWNRALRNGGYWREPPSAPPPTFTVGVGSLTFTPPRDEPAQEEAELWLWGSIMLYDGRLANRGWLQEAPDPVTSIAWGNWVDIHPEKAKALRVKPGDVVELATATGTVTAPARLTEEVPSGAVAIAMGQGHTALGRNARGIGANAFLLTGPTVPGSVFARCRIRRVSGPREYDPTSTAPTRQQFHRSLLQWLPQDELKNLAAGEGEELHLPLPEGYQPGTDLYPPREYKNHRWAMVIDLHRCIGCGACAVACYAENNIAVMGKKQVARQLEMSWLRVVPYEKEDNPRRLAWLPLLCQHCDAAPCEPVCPVFASVHNEEGLNSQIYNRCVGTRYCSNNCPYKVRRFNWLNVEWQKPLDLQLNPEVTVRCRGVMEKCTFCVQRIRLAEYRAAREKRKVADGEIQPACAQSCPTRVYTFGDLLDPHSRVSLFMKDDPRRYQLLAELNTKPAVIYLRRVDGA